MYIIPVVVKIDHEKCSICKLCVELCPAGVFSIDDGKIHVDSDNCIECYGCIPLCPNRAISIKIQSETSLERFMKQSKQD